MGSGRKPNESLTEAHSPSPPCPPLASSRTSFHANPDFLLCRPGLVFPGYNIQYGVLGLTGHHQKTLSPQSPDLSQSLPYLLTSFHLESPLLAVLSHRYPSNFQHLVQGEPLGEIPLHPLLFPSLLVPICP